MLSIIGVLLISLLIIFGLMFYHDEHGKKNTTTGEIMFIGCFPVILGIVLISLCFVFSLYEVSYWIVVATLVLTGFGLILGASSGGYRVGGLILIILASVVYGACNPGNDEDEREVGYDELYEDSEYSIDEETEFNHGSSPSFYGRHSNIKGKCKICIECYQYDGVYNGYWPKCSCGHTYAGHETK